MPLLAGCTVVTLGPEGGNAARQIHTTIGITRIEIPQTAGTMHAVDTQTLGFGWQDGPFVGWNSGSWIEADPAECQMVIIIRSPAQAENAARVIAALEGQQACIADYTGSLAASR